jgi:hypothetical protein
MRVVNEELRFPDDRALDKETKSFIRGLLQKDPVFRLCEPRESIHYHPRLAYSWLTTASGQEYENIRIWVCSI